MKIIITIGLILNIIIGFAFIKQLSGDKTKAEIQASIICILSNLINIIACVYIVRM